MLEEQLPDNIAFHVREWLHNELLACEDAEYADLEDELFDEWTVLWQGKTDRHLPPLERLQSLKALLQQRLQARFTE